MPNSKFAYNVTKNLDQTFGSCKVVFLTCFGVLVLESPCKPFVWQSVLRQKKGCLNFMTVNLQRIPLARGLVTKSTNLWKLECFGEVVIKRFWRNTHLK